jgi:hypothetical protein
MSDDILNNYGKDSGAGQAARATNGGHCEPKPIPYSPPVGPTTFSHEGPGLANHTNHGICGASTQGKH